MNVCVTGWGSACFDETVLKGADSLKLVAHTGGSVSPIVSATFFERGLKIVSGNRLYAESVAEGVIAYILCALRELPFHAGELATGRFKAILDVYEEEPLPERSRLRGMRNAILIPHMGEPTVDRRSVVTLALIDDILNFYAGKPLRHEIGREYALAMTR